MRFDDLSEDDARDLLLRCLSAPGWAEQVLAGRPFGTTDAVLTAADRAARELSPEDLEAGLAGHPRIGERAAAGHNAAASATEQSGVGAGDHERLLAGNLAYEERFGHVFLIRAAGRSPGEMLAELRRRLANDADTERTEATEQLAQITALRVKGLVSDAKVTGERASPQAGGTSRLRGTATEERNESGAEPVS